MCNREDIARQTLGVREREGRQTERERERETDLFHNSTCSRNGLWTKRSVRDLPELKQVDQILLKQIHTATTTFILEVVKHNSDKSTISSCLEDLSFSTDRIEIFYTAYQTHKKELSRLLASIGRQAPHINDVSWRLEYHMKNAHVNKVNEPCYLISLNTEKEGSSEDVSFTCTVEQLQDLVGKLKDAAKSVERAGQI
uniref:COMM domain-containing protein 3 n=1 Tax=Cynoglossus semilaevis TaxID=244447 RepID=A0A3P8VXE1_CYNSE